jgi:hypothetical protein
MWHDGHQRSADCDIGLATVQYFYTKVAVVGFRSAPFSLELIAAVPLLK